jgi:protein-tyrosine phosphatase
VEILEGIDYVFTMTEGHRLQLLSIAPELESKTELLMEYSSGGDVADPFGGSYEMYKECFEQMKKALDNLFAKIVKN